MNYKKLFAYVIYTFLLLQLHAQDNQSTSMTKKINTTIKTENKLIGKEKAQWVLEELLLIAETVSAIAPEDLAKIELICNKCKQHMSCAEFAGHLLGEQMEDETKIEITTLKKLLSEKKIIEIQTFITTTAKKNQIMCPWCKTFCDWSLNE